MNTWGLWNLNSTTFKRICLTRWSWAQSNYSLIPNELVSDLQCRSHYVIEMNLKSSVMLSLVWRGNSLIQVWNHERLAYESPETVFFIAVSVSSKISKLSRGQFILTSGQLTLEWGVRFDLPTWNKCPSRLSTVGHQVHRLYWIQCNSAEVFRILCLCLLPFPEPHP